MLRMLAFATALIATSAHAQALNGTWEGRYVCGQGVTGLTLTVTDDHNPNAPHALTATFNFYAVEENPSVPSGAFTMSGTHSPARNSIVLTGGDWLERPTDYEVVNLYGRHARTTDGDVMTGAVDLPIAPELCTSFELHRRPANVAGVSPAHGR
jgi:hypothetical protein